MKCSLAISNFLEEISSLSHSIVFFYFFTLFTQKGFLISPCYSLDLCIQMGISIFLSFTVPIFTLRVPLGSLIFLKRFLVFPILLFSSISLHCSLQKPLLSLSAVLWNSAFRWVHLSFSPLPFTSLLFSTICKASSDNHFVFFHLFFLGMVLVTTSCTVLWTSIHSSSGTLSQI